MQELLVETLEEEGYQAWGVASAQEALELASRQPLDLVVTDVRMPGVDGVQGLIALKKTQPELKCIVITGYADSDAPARAIEGAINDYLHKPFGLDDFLAVVDRVLNSGRLAAYYQRLIQKLVAAPARMFAAATEKRRQERHRAVEQARDQAFEGLYVGIRSNLISCYSANGLFARLCALEQQYRLVLESDSLETGGDLVQGYRSLHEFLTGMARTNAQFTGADRLPPGEFRHLFNAVKEGRITPEQLHLAPALHTVEPAELASSPELANLRSTMWGS